MTALVTQAQSDIVEQVIIKGDLSQLSPAERVSYYRAVCDSIGLNPLTKPFGYINLKGKLTLYAYKDATDQLRKINRISIGKPDIAFQDDLIIVSVAARDPQGREDSDIGVVRKSDMQGDVANALMKAVTKAKRRVTLSLCGLGWLDETEVETIPDAKRVSIDYDGQVMDTGPSLAKLEQYATGSAPAKTMTDRPTPAPSEPVPDENAKAAKIQGAAIRQAFVDWCDRWITTDDRAARYSKEVEAGQIPQANMFHILARIGKLGFAEVTADNVEAVKAALQKYIEREA